MGRADMVGVCCYGDVLPGFLPAGWLPLARTRPTSIHNIIFALSFNNKLKTSAYQQALKRFSTSKF